MQKQSYNVIGVMSGTSLDGVDLAHLVLTLSNNKWNFHIYEAETTPYDEDWVTTLKSAVNFSKPELDELNRNYTKLLAGRISDFIERHQIVNIDAVCSHGHTILHNPAEKYTLQIGNLAEIANLLGQKVVCDFRV
ncbi:MAG TPA: anhydro-N-acetylmuramic acid kinase, partial [Flavobacterium sp.]